MFFQHVQGSTSFSIVQFSRSCAGRLADSSFIISHQVSFVKHFFEIFLSHPAFRPARCLGDSLFILLHPKPFVKTFFEVFFEQLFKPLCRSGCPRPVRDSVARPPRSGAIIIPCKVGTVKHFLPIFGRKYHFWRFLQFLHRYLNNLTVVLPAVYTGRNFGIPAGFYSV